MPVIATKIIVFLWLALSKCVLTHSVPWNKTDHCHVAQAQVEELLKENAKLKSQLAVISVSPDSEAEKSMRRLNSTQTEAVDVDELPERKKWEDAFHALLSSACVGFLVLNMMLLSLVKSIDADIRKYVWGIMDNSMTIFAAVLVNKIIKDFFTEQLIPCPIPRGFGRNFSDEDAHAAGLEETAKWAHCGAPRPCWLLGCLCVFFVFCFFLLNYFMYHERNYPRRFYSIKHLGQHIVAFAAIAAFGLIQQLSGFNASPARCFLVVIFAWFSFAALKLLSSRYRSGKMQKSSSFGEDQSPVMCTDDQEHEELQQKLHQDADGGDAEDNDEAGEDYVHELSKKLSMPAYHDCETQWEK